MGFNFQKYIVFLSLKIYLFLAKSADPDEMQRHAAFHLGPHCLAKNPFRDFRFSKGLTELLEDNLQVSNELLPQILTQACYYRIITKLFFVGILTL